jgi:type II secretory pathway component PulJ
VIQNRQRNGGKHPRGGFTLMELLAVMFGVGILTIFGCMLLVSIFRVHQRSAEFRQRVTRHETFVDQFRDDVAGARNAPPASGKWKAGPACLILQKPDNTAIIYAETNGEWRRTLEPKGISYELHPGPDGTKLEFHRSGPDNRLVTMRIIVPQTRLAPRREPMEISAALGGDVR